MKKWIFVSLVFIMPFLMTGCVEKTGYYTKAEDDVISLICGVTWASQKIVNDAEETIQGLYKFRNDGWFGSLLGYRGTYNQEICHL